LIKDEFLARFVAERLVEDEDVVFVLTGDVEAVVVAAVVVVCFGTAPVLRLESHSFFIINFTGGVGAIGKYTYKLRLIVKCKLRLKEFAAPTTTYYIEKFNSIST